MELRPSVWSSLSHVRAAPFEKSEGTPKMDFKKLSDKELFSIYLGVHLEQKRRGLTLSDDLLAPTPRDDDPSSRHRSCLSRGFSSS